MNCRDRLQIGCYFLGLLLAGVAGASASAPLQSGSELDYPPYAVVGSEGQASGLSVDLLRESLARVGHEVSFKVAPWADLKDALTAGQLEVLPFVARTPERESLFDFSQPYITTTAAVVIRAGGPAIEATEDLEGLEIAVMAGDAAEEYAHRHGLGENLVRTRSYTDALRDLSVGRFDAVIVQRRVALHLITDLRLRNLRLATVQLPDSRQDWCFAVTEGNRTLADKLDDGLAEIMADGTYDRIVATWIGHSPGDIGMLQWLLADFMLTLFTAGLLGLRHMSGRAKDERP